MKTRIDTLIDVLRGIVLGVLLCQVFIRLLGASTDLLTIRYAGY